MKLGKVGRRAGRLLSVLVLAAAAVYLLRWPLFGGMIRRELSRLAREELGAELSVGALGGTILGSLEARDVRLRFPQDSPVRDVRVGRVAAGYSLFDRSRADVRVDGVEAVLAAAEPDPRPLHERLQVPLPDLRAFRFPGTLSLRDATVRLPDGGTVTIPAGDVDGGDGRFRIRLHDLDLPVDIGGEVRLAVRLSPDGSLDLEAQPAGGPLRRAELRLGPAGPARAFRIRVDADGRRPAAAGTIRSGADGRAAAVEGRLEAAEGRGTFVIDLLEGSFAAEGEAAFALTTDDLAGSVSFRGSLRGSVDEPFRGLQAGPATIVLASATAAGFAADELVVETDGGIPERLPVRGRLRRGGDVVDVKGDASFADPARPAFAGTVKASFADTGPFSAFLPPGLAAAGVRAEGDVRISPGAFAFDGRLGAAEGAFGGLTWTTIEAEGAAGHEGFDLRTLRATGLAGLPEVRASGRLVRAETGWRLAEGRVAAGEDRAVIEGEFGDDGAFVLRIGAEGPGTALSAAGVDLPPRLRPVALRGAVEGSPGAVAFRGDLSLGTAVAVSPDVVVRREEGAWRIVLAPGEVRALEHTFGWKKPLAVRLSPEGAVLDPAVVDAAGPVFAGRVEASFAAGAGVAEGALRIDPATLGGVAVGPIRASGRHDRAAGVAEGEIAAGDPGGDQLFLKGRAGRELDAELRLVVRGLERSPVAAALLPGIPLRGGVRAEARLTGTPAAPELSGRLALDAVSLAESEPATLDLPFRIAGGAFVLPPGTHTIPFGTLELEGRADLPGFAPPGAEPAVDVVARTVLAGYQPLLRHLPEDLRPWIPAGILRVEAVVRGPLVSADWRIGASFRADRFAPPPPLGELTDLQVEAVLDRAGLRLESLEGRLGKGPFRIEGGWDLWSSDRPLRIRLTGEDLLVVDERRERIRADPDLVLTSSDSTGPRVTGRIDLPLVIDHREFGATAGDVKARDVAAPGLRLIPSAEGGFYLPGLEGLEGVAIDVGVATTGECRIENSAVGVLLDAKGRLRGTAGRPAASGRADVRRGEVRLTTGVFVRIVKAHLELPEVAGQEPTVRFEGRVGKGDGSITLIVAGPLDRPSLTLESTPPRPQKELLAHLAFGRAPGDVSEQAAAGAVAAKVVQYYTDDWPRADREESFFDRVDVSVVNEERSTRSTVPWEIPASGSARGTVVRTEYFLTESISIVAENDLEANVGGYLRFRFRFR